MDDGGELRIVDMIEISDKAGGERGKLPIHPSAAARHRRAFRDAEFTGSRENRFDAGMPGRADRRPHDVDERAPGFSRDFGGQRAASQRVEALRECGGDGTHWDNSSRRMPLVFEPSSPTLTIMTKLSEEISTNTAGTPECFSNAATQKPTKIQPTRPQPQT